MAKLSLLTIIVAILFFSGGRATKLPHDPSEDGPNRYEEAAASDMMAKKLGGKQFGRGKEKKDPAVKSDLKYIRCQTCEAIVKHAIMTVKQNRSQDTAVKKVSIAGCCCSWSTY